MGIHEWDRVPASVFHDFHLAWVAELHKVLNSRVLPACNYAMIELTGDATLGEQSFWYGSATFPNAAVQGSHAYSIDASPPRVSVRDTATEAMLLAARRKRIVIRHQTGDRIVALIEVVSQGNKEKRGAVETFVDKAVGALDEGYHLLVLDLLPPRSADPQGMRGAIWKRLGGAYDAPPGKPLTLAAYAVDGPVTCYVEPTAVGAESIEMPLFLDPGHYVNVPLEATYAAAYEGVPRRWRRVIEGDHA
jgi:hypothetical protein